MYWREERQKRQRGGKQKIIKIVCCERRKIRKCHDKKRNKRIIEDNEMQCKKISLLCYKGRLRKECVVNC